MDRWNGNGQLSVPRTWSQRLNTSIQPLSPSYPVLWPYAVSSVPKVSALASVAEAIPGKRWWSQFPFGAAERFWVLENALSTPLVVRIGVLSTNIELSLSRLQTTLESKIYCEVRFCHIWLWHYVYMYHNVVSTLPQAILSTRPNPNPTLKMNLCIEIESATLE